MKSFAIMVGTEENTFFPRLFKEETIIFLLSIINGQRDGSDQLRLTFASCLGEYSEWLSVKPEYLGPCLNFLLHELQFSPKPAVAANSLTEMCSICQIQLSKHCDEVLDLCMNSLPKVPTHVQSKIIQSMLYIIQALDPSEASKRSKYIFENILIQLEGDIQLFVTVPETAEMWENLKLHLDFLSSFCKGSKHSPIEIEETETVELSPEDKLIGNRFIKVVEVLINRFSSEKEFFATIANVLVECTKCEIAIIYKQNVQILELCCKSFVATPIASIFNIFTSALIMSKKSMIEYETDIYYNTFINMIATYMDKWSLEFMHYEPDVTCEFFNLLESVFIILIRFYANYQIAC
jgi:hypothetical protein